ncbi:hypothetical protein EC957_010549 [Mortierella hygrophila]|uniref:Uncharacterized protein n=1 Tax=Mortierella hygrophila TaxID=979708 RepID=A0A9P6EWK5_9FUNG|nr:hypothetical protein EC957_010549 [Mortierella hygrophila]
MPRISERRRILDETEEVILAALFTSDDELLELAMMYYAWAEESRYLNRSVVYTKADRSFFDIKYYNMSDDVFRQRFRVTRQAFRTIARMIEQHPIFHRNSSSPQLHPAWQLLVALTRLGHYGSRMAVKLVADEMGISSGAHWCRLLLIGFGGLIMSNGKSMASAWALRDFPAVSGVL